MDDTKGIGEGPYQWSGKGMSENILVYDIGTSSVKTALFSLEGVLVSAISIPYTTIYQRPGWAQQDPQSFWHAAIEGTHALLEALDAKPFIAIISVCGHMNGMLAIDDKGVPTYPEIIHCDTRSVNEVSFIQNLYSQQDIYRITGNRIDEFLTLPKLLWLKGNQEDAYRRTRFVINAKDYVRMCLTGVLGTTDFSDASLTGALNIREKRWDEGYLSSLGIPLSIFPSLHLSTDIEGFLSAESAKLLGLPSGIPVCYGAGDAASATRGAMVSDVGSAYASLGSSAWISTLYPTMVDDPQMRMQHFYDLDGEKINICGTVQSAGSALQWAKDRFAPSSTFEELEQKLSRLPMPNSIIALPYLMGERTPHWDAYARTSFMGVSQATTALEMALSLYEGVAYALYETKEVYDELRIPIRSLTLLGGGVKSTFWLEMIASVFGRPLSVHPHYQNGTSFGAALCAMVANKSYASLEEAIASSALTFHTVEPDMHKHEMYLQYYSVYTKMYQSLKPLFADVYRLNKSYEEDFS
ncbi:MAG: hypothetical protein JEY71_00020 [Sphaerochaeta sp.]|nr:hypothetical protein [Sphaerochaeta sp.]